MNSIIRSAYIPCDASSVLFVAAQVPCVVNVIILLAKRYIDVQCRDGRTLVNVQLRSHLQFDEADIIISLRENRMKQFVAKWRCIGDVNAIAI